MSSDSKTWSELFLNRVRRDITPFVDPGTKLEIAEAGRSLSATWERNGKRFDVTFIRSSHLGIQVSQYGRTVAYRSFLVGPDMADLSALAKSIERTTPQGFYIETQAQLDENQSKESKPAVSLLQEILHSDVVDHTHLIFVTGDAGAGKTRTLQELVAVQATAYLSGETPSVYLYINAQGRALARFNEALATELQDLRAPFTYHVVSTLVRIGAVVPIIDGFDELIGVSGYDDAFNSLAAFIEDLSGEGKLIASARSSYYEEEFIERSHRTVSESNNSWRQTAVRVLQWGADERQKFAESYADERRLTPDQRNSLTARLDSTFQGRNEALGRKPLFVARTAELLVGGFDVSDDQDLLDELVRGYLEREQHEKLLDKNGKPLLTASQLKKLIASLAEEMWNQETREFDRRSVRDVAEYALLDEDITESTQQILVERMPTLAFLTASEGEGSVAFEHETFFSYFLAWTFAGIFERTTMETRMLLSRSALPSEVAERVANSKRLNINNSFDFNLALTKLSDAGKTAVSRASLVQENAGLLAFAILLSDGNGDPIRARRIERLIFAGLNFSKAIFQDCEFRDVQFKRCDFSATRFESCTGENLLFQEPIIDPHVTRIDIDGLRVATGISGIRIRVGEKLTVEYDPHRIVEALTQVGLLSEESVIKQRAVAPKYLELLERLMRGYRRANPICSDDDHLKGIFQSPEWVAVESALVRHRIVTDERRQASGTAKIFYRRQYLPDQIMAGVYIDARVDRNIQAFWQELERLP